MGTPTIDNGAAAVSDAATEVYGGVSRFERLTSYTASAVNMAFSTVIAMAGVICGTSAAFSTVPICPALPTLPILDPGLFILSAGTSVRIAAFGIISRSSSVS